jgi:hypothetical protein
VVSPHVTRVIHLDRLGLLLALDDRAERVSGGAVLVASHDLSFLRSAGITPGSALTQAPA